MNNNGMPVQQQALACDNAGKERFLRLCDVKLLTGLSRSTIYLYIQTGRFPRPVNIGMRSVAWLQSEIDAWMTARIAGSRNK